MASREQRMSSWVGSPLAAEVTSRDLNQLDLLAMFIDGINTGDLRVQSNMHARYGVSWPARAVPGRCGSMQ